jgi:hypothetical protein
MHQRPANGQCGANQVRATATAERPKAEADGALGRLDMADKNQSPPRRTEPIARTVASITREGRGPQTRAYDDPDLSPIEFLQAVYHATHLPMSVRIQAASALLPYTNSFPRPQTIPPRRKIIIGGLGPYDHESGAEAPEQINTISQSKSAIANNSHQPSSETPGPLYTETNSYPPTLIDYSQPLTPTEIQQIKAAVHALRPDFDPSQPIPLYLCVCGHWLTFPCDCVTIH